MSLRTLIEINHDAVQIGDDLLEALSHYVASASRENADWGAALAAALAAAWNAAWGAAWDAALAAALAAAWNAAWDAARAKLEPTRQALQQSALALVERMIDLTEAA